MKVLIIEDEQRAGEKLKDLIGKHLPEAASVEWLRSVEDSLDYLNVGHTPDLIFSDIELLDGNSFEIYQEFTPPCPIIFCTAYNQYFLDAFKTNGIAYLLKPFTEEEFVEALAKYQTLFKVKALETPAIDPNLLMQLQGLMVQTPKKYKQTFTVKKPSGVFLLNVQEVTYFQAQGDFVFAFDTKGHKHILNHTLAHIEEQVNPENFFRVNRSELIHFHAIEKYYAYIKNRLEISLKDGQTTLYTSNSRTAEFRSWIESM